MTAHPRTGYEDVASTLAQSIDAACDRFESAWRAGPVTAGR